MLNSDVPFNVVDLCPALDGSDIAISLGRQQFYRFQVWIVDASVGLQVVALSLRIIFLNLTRDGGSTSRVD